MQTLSFEYFPRVGLGREEMIACSIKEGNATVQEIFVQEHSIFELIKWLKDNWQAILNEPPLNFLPETSSLRDAQYACRDSWPDDCEEGSELDKLIDEQYDALYWYKQRHGLRSGFQGADIHDVYLGLYRGTLTVSWQANGVSYSYEIEPKVEIKNRLDNSTIVLE